MSDDLMAAFGNLTFKFWTCPVVEHHERVDDDGHQLSTVEWIGDVAHCTTAGCGRTSADPGAVYGLVARKAQLEGDDGELVDRDGDEWVVELPHQCDAWTVAGDDDNPVPRAQAVGALEVFIREAQAVLDGLKAHGYPEHAAKRGELAGLDRPDPTRTHRYLVRPAHPVWTAVISPDCRCTWDRDGESHKLAVVDLACPLHGRCAPFDACTLEDPR